MIKIPVKIVEVTSPSGVTKKGVMLDVIDYIEIPGNAQKQVKKFEKLYFSIVKKAQKIFPKKKTERKTDDSFYRSCIRNLVEQPHRALADDSGADVGNAGLRAGIDVARPSSGGAPHR